MKRCGISIKAVATQARHASSVMPEQVRQSRKAAKDVRMLDLAQTDSAVAALSVKDDANFSVRDRLLGMQALERLNNLERIPKEDVLGEGAEARDMPLPQQHMDDIKTKHYIVLCGNPGFRKRSRVLKAEYTAGLSSLPDADATAKAVQIRGPNGEKVFGYGYYKPSDGTVFAIFWISRRGTGPIQTKAENGDLSLGTRFWYDRIFKALEYRQTVMNLEQTQSFVLLNGDADGCPGVVVKMYQDAASVLVVDRVALNYLHNIVSFIQTRTPVTSMYVTGASKAITSSIPEDIRGMLGGNFKNIVVTENGTAHFVHPLSEVHQFRPEKRLFREMVTEQSRGNVAVLGDTNGSLAASLLKSDEVKKVVVVNSSEEHLKVAKNNVKYNFVEDDAEFKVTQSRRGFVYHMPDLSQRVIYHTSEFDSFLGRLSSGYNTLVLDFHGTDGLFRRPEWVTQTLRRAIMGVDVDKETGGTIFIVSVCHLFLRS